MHHTIPLLVARLVCHETQIQEIQDHLEEHRVKRLEAIEQGIEGLHGNIKATQQDFKAPQDTLHESREQIRDLEIRLEDIEASLQESEARQIRLSERKKRTCIYFIFFFAIKIAIGLNVFQHDPSPHGRILLLVFLLNSFHREGPQNSAMISRCSNNIMENLYQKHGLVSRTYYKKSLIVASTFGSKSKFFMAMSIPSQDKPLTKWPVLERPNGFAKPVKTITLPQDVLSTSDCRLIELKNQVQRLMEAHLAPTQPTQVNKVTTLCEISSGPCDTQYYMEDPEQAFVENASSHTNEAR
nr:hypothetical protein [Tanacetum cinerariifolium]